MPPSFIAPPRTEIVQRPHLVENLQLAALSMQGRTDISAFVQGFTGSHVCVAEYLIEEILKQQPEEVQQFLLQTSILDRLSAGLCDAITGGRDGQAVLTTLHRANIFVVPLDENGRWFRYHHLFADLLRARLPQALPAEAIAAGHKRAGLWYEDQGFMEEAIHHFLAAQEFERVAALVEQETRSLMFAGQARTLRNWLDALPMTPIISLLNPI